jgi:hypothetical protein
MSSTSEDMAKFMIAHLQNGTYRNKRILQETTTRQMHTLLFTNDPRVNGMTYGFWEIRQDPPRAVGHGGDTILFHTLLVLIPEDRTGIFISSNELAAEPAVHELLQTFMDHYYPASPSQISEPVSGFEENASLFAGSYRQTRSAYTNFEKLLSLFQEIQVSQGPNSTLTTSQLGAGSKKWVEVEPEVFRRADSLPSQESLVFGKNKNGDISYLFLKLNPTTAYEKVAWNDDLGFNLSLLGVCILLFLSTLIWVISLIFNRCPIKEPRKPAKYARWLAGGASMLNLLFLSGLISLFLANPVEADFLYTMPSWLTALFATALIASILALASAAFTFLAWKDSYWNLAGRIHYTLVVLALLVFVWWLNNWNLLGFRF